MLLGGPFSFLAGLFCLGASGVMKVAEDAQVRERYREFASHKYPPYGLINELSSCAQRDKEFGGYDGRKIEKVLQSEYEVPIYDASLVRGTLLAKKYIEEIGYEFDAKQDNNHRKTSCWCFIRLDFDEYLLPKAETVKNCHTLDELQSIQGLKVHSALTQPYRLIEKYQRMGFMKDVVIPPEYAWNPYNGDR